MDNQPVKRPPNIVESAIEAGMALAPKVIASPLQDGRPFVVLQDRNVGQVAQYLDQTIDHPPRKIACVLLDDVSSFINYWNIHAAENSQIYASMEKPQFTAVFDDHHGAGDDACYRGHRARFSPKHSPEYLAWKGKNGKDNAFSDNEQFALWIEDQLPDFVSPSGALMLQMALNFKVVQNASFGKAVRLQDGNTKITFTNEVQGSSGTEAGTIQIPDVFTINIPIYAGLGSLKFSFDARFRYRLNGGKLTMWYELIRPHKVVEMAFGEIVSEMSDATKRTVLFGSPE